MNVLAIEPYFGGSHRAFLDGVMMASRHRWTPATLPARHWKWRMRSAPAALNQSVSEILNREPVRPDVIVCSDMLDLPTWLGLATRDPNLDEWVS